MWLVDVSSWLSTKGLQQQLCWRKLPAQALDACDELEISAMKGQPIKAYRIDILTGNQWKGGTNDQVRLNIDGTNYSTTLNMSWKKSATHSTPFCAGQHDVFLFDGKVRTHARM